MFLLERKAMNNHKERWNTFSTHSEWNFLLLGIGMAWQQHMWSPAPDPEFYLVHRVCDDLKLYVATLHLDRSTDSNYSLYLCSSSTFYQNKTKKTEIEEEQSLKSYRNHTTKGYLSIPFKIRFIILVAMTTWCNFLLPWQSVTTFKKQ